VGDLGVLLWREWSQGPGGGRIRDRAMAAGSCGQIATVTTTTAGGAEIITVTAGVEISI
jgi:hypothetical protein